jgi:hypothetical protein
MRPCEGRGGGFDSPRTPYKQECAPGRASGLQSRPTGFKSLRSCSCRCGSIVERQRSRKAPHAGANPAVGSRGPGGVMEQHPTLLKSRSRFESGPGCSKRQYPNEPPRRQDRQGKNKRRRENRRLGNRSGLLRFFFFSFFSWRSWRLGGSWNWMLSSSECGGRHTTLRRSRIRFDS